MHMYTKKLRITNNKTNKTYTSRKYKKPRKTIIYLELHEVNKVFLHYFGEIKPEMHY